jgi:chromosome segregation ATPase
MWKSMPWILAALLILTAGSAARAQTTTPSSPSPSGSLEQEVRQLNQSVQELVALLRAYFAHRDVDLLLRRVEIGLQKIGPLNQELTSLRAQNFADEEQLGKNRSALTAIQTREAEDGTSPDPQVTTDDATRKVQLEAEIKRLRRRISETEQRIVEVENELAEGQRNLQQWEALIDRLLGQR